MIGKYLVVEKTMLPEVFTKVIETKELLQTQKAKDISEAVKMVGISRSTFYKYKDSVFIVTDGVIQHKATIGLTLGHQAGTLSKVLDKVADSGGNILTINQDIPINNTANVTITLDIAKLTVDFAFLLEDIKNIDNIIKSNLIAME